MNWRIACAQQGQTVVLVAIGGEPAGVIGVADPIKSTARAAVSALKADGLRLLMLTGDNRVTASAVAQSLGIDQIEADVLPDRKAAVIKALQTAGAKVAMAGDGINDAPALAQADVGIAMGTGTDIAMESASITLVKGDLTGRASCADAQPRHDERTSARICFLRSCTTWRESRSPRACSTRCSDCFSAR